MKFLSPGAISSEELVSMNSMNSTRVVSCEQTHDYRYGNREDIVANLVHVLPGSHKNTDAIGSTVSMMNKNVHIGILILENKR